jgi:ribonuclease HII
MLKTFYDENKLEAGLDEAGRGPLFGRVYTAAVILNPYDEYNFDLIKDSKKLSERKRLIAFDYIKENVIDYSIHYNDEKVIDNMNILKATYNSMHKALDNLSTKPELLLVDGNYFVPYLNLNTYEYIPHVCIKSGDNTYASIAAASILAKVSRDTYIHNLCDKYNELDDYYSIRSNKGYGAKKHMDGIKQYGITKWHRKSFSPCDKYNTIDL